MYERQLSYGMAFLFALVMVLAVSTPLHAQRGGAALILPSYNFDTDEFLIGGYNYGARPDSGGIDQHWKFQHDLGINVGFIAHLTNRQIDTLASLSPLRRPEIDRFVPLAVEPFWQAGFGREITFYLFDSVQSPYWQCRFLDIRGGVRSSVGYGSLAGIPHRAYTNTAETGLILSAMALGCTPDDTRPDYTITEQFIDQQRFSDGKTYSIAVTARLIPADGSISAIVPGALANEHQPVLKVLLYHAIQRGKQFLGSKLDTIQALRDTMILCDAFLITPYDIANATAVDTTTGYSTIARATDLRRRAIDSGPGPLHPGQPKGSDGSRAIDMQVYWKGNGPVALHSVALRDSIGELMLGSSYEANQYRQKLMEVATRILKGENGDEQLRNAIYRLETGHEPQVSEYAGYNAVDRLLQENFTTTPNGTAPANTFRAMLIDGSAQKTFTHLTNQPEMYVETYLNDPHDTSTMYDGEWAFLKQQQNGGSVQELMKIPHNQIPTLPEHNGGQFTLPLLELTPQAIEDYETTIQRAYFGRVTGTEEGGWPFNRTHVSHLYKAARLCRETGKRLIVLPGTVASMTYRYRPGSNGEAMNPDTVMSHFPEPAELRASVNLALCYGARGIVWWHLGGAYKLGAIQKSAQAHVYEACCLGAASDYMSDTAIDRKDLVISEAGGSELFQLQGFYTGWKTRSAEIQALNTGWLQHIGKEMVKLRWRDAYSAHTFNSWPELQDEYARPLPDDELLRGVRSKALRSEEYDPPHRTFVEIGLFDTKPTGSAQPLGAGLSDTNYVFVVNRRTFERPPYGINPERAAMMDELAETREITLQFNGGYSNLPDGTKMRVREIEPDTTPLPGTSAPRIPLDVVIQPGAEAIIQLGPGRGALLQVTYLPEGN